MLETSLYIVVHILVSALACLFVHKCLKKVRLRRNTTQHKYIIERIGWMLVYGKQKHCFSFLDGILVHGKSHHFVSFYIRVASMLRRAKYRQYGLKPVCSLNFITHFGQNCGMT